MDTQNLWSRARNLTDLLDFFHGHRDCKSGRHILWHCTSSLSWWWLVTIIATLGVLWASRRVASPSIEIPIHFWKKKFADKLHKSYKKHPWQTSPTFSGHFTLQAEPKINWNNYISMVLWACFSNKVCIYQKTNNQNGGCYDHMTHEISLAGSHSLHWGRVQWKIPCLRAKRFS